MVILLMVCKAVVKAVDDAYDEQRVNHDCCVICKLLETQVRLLCEG